MLHIDQWSQISLQYLHYLRIHILQKCYAVAAENNESSDFVSRTLTQPKKCN